MDFVAKLCLAAIVKKTMHDFVEYFLQSVSDINATNVYGSTLLHNAVLTGDKLLFLLCCDIILVLTNWMVEVRRLLQ
jgi:ankyrin repeat protein